MLVRLLAVLLLFLMNNTYLRAFQRSEWTAEWPVLPQVVYVKIAPKYEQSLTIIRSAHGIFVNRTYPEGTFLPCGLEFHIDFSQTFHVPTVVAIPQRSRVILLEENDSFPPSSTLAYFLRSVGDWVAGSGESWKKEKTE